jgi:hypothetical protein
MTAAPFADLRAHVAAALSAFDEEVAVLEAPVDAVEPPAFMLTWSQPWIQPSTPCVWTTRLDVLAIAGRIDPDPGVAELERLVAGAISYVRDVPIVQVTAPGGLEIGGVMYLVARITMQSSLLVEVGQ